MDNTKLDSSYNHRFGLLQSMDRLSSNLAGYDGKKEGRRSRHHQHCTIGDEKKRGGLPEVGIAAIAFFCGIVVGLGIYFVLDHLP